MNITQTILQQMAYGASFSKGKDYFLRGLVKEIAEIDNRIIAKVGGSDLYRVQIWEGNKQLKFSCTCPVGEDGCFCKHCVAVGLQWMANNETPSKNINEVTLQDIKGWLSKQNIDVLVSLLMEQVYVDDQLEQKLSLKIAKSCKNGINIHAYCDAIDRAVYTGGFIDYREAYAYCQNLDNVVDSIEELLKENQAANVMSLVAYALPKVEEAIQEVDDSDGGVGGILCRLEDIYYQACLQVKPDPKILANKLFNFEMQSDFDAFYHSAEKYAEILGDKGLKVYYDLANDKWEKIKTLAPNEQDAHEYDNHRFRITSIMESLARQTGDIEKLIAVKKKDLSHSYSYLQIAEVYREAGRYDKAIEWAEKGIADFPGKPDSRLQDFLAEEYHRAKRDKDAINQVWQKFLAEESLSCYEQLKQYADHAHEWENWRKRALTHIRKVLGDNQKQQKKVTWHSKSDHSLLVQIFIWEGDVETAWLEAVKGGCSRNLWLELAKKREKTHPKGAIKIYQDEVEASLEQKDYSGYERAIEYLKIIERLMKIIECGAAFNEYISQLKVAHKPKRNFMKLLNIAKW